MMRYSSQSTSHQIWAKVAAIALLSLAWGLAYGLSPVQVGAASPETQDSTPNNHLERNQGGKAATFSTQGAVNLTGEYFQAQGTNGRSCASCHIQEEAWSINPGTL